ncbi:uncharacterized protein PAN0_065d6554 [Moesziomyces antarcticus]|uniref:Uncharacterized protein n=1 Tax=Pseudozyma antarctica TaxID=84753 RepID=A0A081CNR3_PSEA2|nr:uncharacterized protein PAN0_065d6554 [Moesziomyces antarcticus]GAK68309.1 hypothetical protein PAN0_065d6554 [Moesziomyces antarcticus]
MTAASNDFQFDSIPDGTSYLPGATLHTLDLSILTGRQDTSTGAALPVADVNAAYLHQIGDSANLFSLTSAGLSLVLDQDREYVIIGELLKSNTAVVHNHINDRPCLSRVVGVILNKFLLRLSTSSTSDMIILIHISTPRSKVACNVVLANVLKTFLPEVISDELTQNMKIVDQYSCYGTDAGMKEPRANPSSMTPSSPWSSCGPRASSFYPKSV